MRVDKSGSNAVQGSDVASTQEAAKTAKAKATKGKSGAAGANATGDPGAAKTEVSARGRESAKAHAVAKDAPDVREEKIAELKRRIAGGTYNVDSDAIADKMVNEHLDTAGLG